MGVYLALAIQIFKQPSTELKLFFIVSNVLPAELSTIFLNADKILLNVFYRSINFTSLKILKKFKNHHPHRDIFGRCVFYMYEIIRHTFSL